MNKSVTEAEKLSYQAPKGELFQLPESRDLLASFSLTLAFEEWEEGDDLDFI